MAGWRARNEWAAEEPVDLVDDGDRSEVEVAGGRTVDWHATIRTGAAVVAALSLLWMGRSWADERTDASRSSCLSDVQQAYNRYEQFTYMGNWNGQSPPVERSIAEDLAEQARACGGDSADLYAEALLYVPPDDRDD